MRSCLALSLLPLVATATKPRPYKQAATAADYSDPTIVCNLLKSKYSNITYLPTDAGYEAESQVSWDASSWLGPACIFAPRSAHDLSYAVKEFKRSNTLFAMRGGGHMPIPTAANINSTGVQISSTNLNTLKLSEDKHTMSIGPGPRWGDVFEYMDGSNLTVVGGRLAPVGVPGLLLGGGVSYFSGARGFASSEGKIKAYECVLPDGTIATVTAKGKYKDLYWALSGGGNSYALVTRFDLQTFPLESALRAEAYYQKVNVTKDAYLNALLEFNLDDAAQTHAAVIPVVRWAPGYTAPSYETSIFYNGTVAPTTGSFSTFYDGTIPAINSTSTLHPMSLAAYSKLLRPAFQGGGPGHGFRQRFHIVAHKSTREAMDIVHDTWFALLRSTDIANHVPGFFAGLAFNTVSKAFTEHSQNMPMTIAREAQFWVEEAISWSNASDDAEIEKFIEDVNEEITAKLEAKNLTVPYLYLNDASLTQKVFEGYGTENVKKLKAIRSKYDPERVFTDLLPGGFKIANFEADCDN